MAIVTAKALQVYQFCDGIYSTLKKKKKNNSVSSIDRLSNQPTEWFLRSFSILLSLLLLNKHHRTMKQKILGLLKPRDLNAKRENRRGTCVVGFILRPLAVL